MSSQQSSVTSLPVVSRSTSAQEIVSLSDQAGAVIIRNFMTAEQVVQINKELDVRIGILTA